MLLWPASNPHLLPELALLSPTHPPIQLRRLVAMYCCHNAEEDVTPYIPDEFPELPGPGAEPTGVLLLVPGGCKWLACRGASQRGGGLAPCFAAALLEG